MPTLLRSPADHARSAVKDVRRKVLPDRAAICTKLTGWPVGKSFSTGILGALSAINLGILGAERRHSGGT